MKINELYSKGQVVSFEMFPPKKDADIAGIYEAAGKLAAMKPAFISVTYGAGGGGNGNRTAEIAKHIQQEYGVASMAHLTCITAEKERIDSMLDDMRADGIENILALRGDIPRGSDIPFSKDYAYAEDLIRHIRERGGFCIGAACYPEGHIDCEDLGVDIERMLRKEQAGADFFVSQLFFDNEQYFRFLERARAKGIASPIEAGVMPIMSRAQIERMIYMCGASMPSRIVKMLHRYEDNPDDLRKAGIEYAAQQLKELLDNGVDGVHIYTMNKPDIARVCMEHIGKL